MVFCVAAVAVLGGGEASGPLMPPPLLTEDCFSAGEAASAAYAATGLQPGDIDYWGLYDCFPICLIRWVTGSGQDSARANESTCARLLRGQTASRQLFQLPLVPERPKHNSAPRKMLLMLMLGANFELSWA